MEDRFVRQGLTALTISEGPFSFFHWSSGPSEATMAHAKDDGLSPLVVSPPSPSEERALAEGPPRPSPPRTPPRVWPPVSPADMERVVRRLKASGGRPRDEEPRVTLVEGVAG